MPRRSKAEQRRWEDLRLQVLTGDANTCRDCGERTDRPLHVHHLIPLSGGGLDEFANLVSLCESCHAARHPKQQMFLARRTIRRWVVRLATFLDQGRTIPSDIPDLHAVLAVLGQKQLRPAQLHVILEILKGNSVLVVWPTGSGKSLCFEVPPLIRPGFGLVISPLKSLMNEQIASLTKRKIPATFVNSEISYDDKRQRYSLLQGGALKFFVCAPERFDPAQVRAKEVQALLTLRPSFFIVDEAHCIVRWGQDFRPSYSQLGILRQKIGNPPLLAFTATAGPAVRAEILESLRAPDAKVFVQDSDRPNIALVRLDRSDDEADASTIKSLIDKCQGRAMVFVPTVKTGLDLKGLLSRLGMELPFYHSKYGIANDRDLLLGRFMGRNDPPLLAVICTNAFGMGLDVSNVRLVVHWQQPASAEDYLQEFGRAGRDGKPALAVVLAGPKDDRLLKYMARKNVELIPDWEERNARLSKREAEIDLLKEMIHSRGRCFRDQLTSYFNQGRLERPRSLPLRILEWLFGTRRKNRAVKACCDYCTPRIARKVRQGKFPKLRSGAVTVG